MLNKTTTFEEFSALLMQEHGIAVKESRGRLSYCPPGRTKFITAKKLSKKLEKEQVLTALSQNIQLLAQFLGGDELCPTGRAVAQPASALFHGNAVFLQDVYKRQHPAPAGHIFRLTTAPRLLPVSGLYPVQSPVS